jgi:hypothetical protein
MLFLSGSIPGLLRRGAPVVPTESGDWPDFGPDSPRRGVVVAVCRPGLVVVGVQYREYGGDGTSCPIDRLSLDLTDPAGVDVALRWCAERLGIAGRPAWWRWDTGEVGWAIGRSAGVAYGTAHVFPIRQYDVAIERIGGQTWRTVPALADIDLADPHADARALRAIVLHLAGLTM